MADVQKLANMLKELDDQLVTCMRCGMCQAVCPVFKETGRETDVARGKLALLDGMASEMLKDAEGVKMRLDKCLLCGTCQANCPSGVKVTDIFLKARAILTGYIGLSPAKKLIFKGLLSKPELFNTVLRMGSKFQGLFTKPVNDMLGSSCARFQAPVVGDRHFKGLADTPLHVSRPSMKTAAGKSGLTVGFYPGCVVDKVFPQVGEAVIKVLSHYGVGVFMPKGQACCGIPALSSGDAATAKDLALRNVHAFDASFDYLITPCATCTATMAHLWPEWAADDLQTRGRIKQLAGKAMDLSTFLVDVLKARFPGNNENGTVVTYHDPCHLKNSFGITAQPRAVLKGLPGYTFKEMNEAGACCGSGGSFNLQHYALSEQIGRRKAQNVIDCGAQVAATSCPACMMQLTDFLSKRNAKVRVAHVAELLAESL